VDIGAWLYGIGLQRYEQAFRDNAIDAEVLPELTADDLRDIGVNLVGHRRKLLAAVAALRGGMEPVPQAAAATAIAERRQLTVMFCDLVGSTELASRLDPEDLRGVIAGYHCALAEVVKRFEGFVARYMGDGMLIYFGYPRAHEDDAERAARCALAVFEAVSGLKLAEALRARIGIATGTVVVGGGAPEHDVVGETPNLAARLQSLAAANTVLIDETTRRLIGGLFEYQDLGAVEARGFTDAVAVWQVLRPSAVASLFEALRAFSPTPLIGRSDELEYLSRRWERAKEGDGQVVLLSGEPGIGKSRIAGALAERLRGELHYHLRYFCAAPSGHRALPSHYAARACGGLWARRSSGGKAGKAQAIVWPRASCSSAAAGCRSCRTAFPQQRSGVGAVVAGGGRGAASIGRRLAVTADRRERFPRLTSRRSGRRRRHSKRCSAYWRI
jgi:class 3 adenylate cyclase